MKTIFTIFIFFAVFTTYSQSESFCNGWTAGFKAGYCYGTYGCVAPYAPPCALPNIGNDNYQGGYNQGFVAGKNQKEGQEVQNTTNGGAYGQLRPLQNTNTGKIVEDYIRNNRSNDNDAYVKTYSKSSKTEDFKFLVKNILTYYRFELYSSCVEQYPKYKKYKKYRKYDNRVEYAIGYSYWKMYQEDKNKSHLKKAIKVLEIAKDHGNRDADFLINQINKETK